MIESGLATARLDSAAAALDVYPTTTAMPTAAMQDS